MKVSEIICIYCRKDSRFEALHRINKGETPAEWVHASCNEIHRHVLDSETVQICDIISGKEAQ